MSLAPLKFVVVGCLNTLLGLGVIYACKFAVGMGDLWANVAGYAAGLTLSFALNRRWTFAHDGPWIPALGRFLAAFLLSYSVNLTVVMALIDGAGVNGYIAQAAGIPPYTITFYLLSKIMVFRRQAPRSQGLLR